MWYLLSTLPQRWLSLGGPGVDTWPKLGNHSVPRNLNLRLSCYRLTLSGQNSNNDNVGGLFFPHVAGIQKIQRRKQQRGFLSSPKHLGRGWSYFSKVDILGAGWGQTSWRISRSLAQAPTPRQWGRQWGAAQQLPSVPGMLTPRNWGYSEGLVRRLGGVLPTAHLVAAEPKKKRKTTTNTHPESFIAPPEWNSQHFSKWLHFLGPYHWLFCSVIFCLFDLPSHAEHSSKARAVSSLLYAVALCKACVFGCPGVR